MSGAVEHPSNAAPQEDDPVGKRAADDAQAVGEVAGVHGQYDTAAALKVAGLSASSSAVPP
jgi:hypothetical protein